MANLQVKDGAAATKYLKATGAGDISDPHVPEHLESNSGTVVTNLGGVTETAPGTDTASSGLNGRLQRIAQRLTSLIALLPGSLGQKTAANSLAVVVASDQSNVPTKELRSSAATLSNVASSATNVTILASNGNRLGAMVQNDSTQVLYLKFGATASSSSYTVQMAAGDYYEVPSGYTGQIDGIWASANGNARVTELT